MAQISARLGTVGERMAYMDNDRDYQVIKSLFKNSPRKMKSKLRNDKFGIATMTNNFIYGVTEDVMSALVVGGIPQYFLKYIEKNVLREMPVDPPEPKDFSIEDLEFGFMIFLICCGISIAIFLIEILMFYGRKILCFRKKNKRRVRRCFY